MFLYGKYNGQVGEWLKPGDCKSPASGYVGSNPTLSTNFRSVRIEVITADCLSAYGGSIPPQTAKFLSMVLVV